MVKEQGFIIIQDVSLLLTIWEFILLPQDPDRPPEGRRGNLGKGSCLNQSIICQGVHYNCKPLRLHCSACTYSVETLKHFNFLHQVTHY